MTNLEYACIYAERFGFAVFPLGVGPCAKTPNTEHGCKDATTDLEQISAWWNEWPTANIGIATGKASGGLVVVDIDVHEDRGVNGNIALRKWQQEHGAFPDTVCVTTPSGGEHYYFRVSESYKNSTGVLEGIDTRGDGGYVVAPPSRSSAGDHYIWDMSPTEWEIAEANQSVLDLLKLTKQKEFPETVVVGEMQVVPEGERNHKMYSLACSFQAKGLPHNTIVAAVMSANNELCKPPLEYREIESIVASAEKNPKGTKSKEAYEKELAVNSQLAKEKALGLEFGKSGRPLTNYSNVRKILSYTPEFAGLIRYDELLYNYVVDGQLPWMKRAEQREWTNMDYAAVRTYFGETYGIKGQDIIRDCIEVVAHENTYNPVVDFLEKEVPLWDGKDHIGELAPKYLGAEDTPVTRACIRTFMIGAVVRAFHPGTKFDLCLILTGPQGCGKSSFLRGLAFKDRWFDDNFSSIEGKDACDKLRGKWIVEMSEMYATKKTKEMEALKAFLTSTDDNYRAAYKEISESHPRRVVFAATTNEAQFLNDSTGDRRFLPLACTANHEQVLKGRGYTEEFKNDVLQAWAQAVNIYKSDDYELIFPRELESALNTEKLKYTSEDAELEIIADFMAGSKAVQLTARDVWTQCFKMDRPPTIADSRRVVAKMAEVCESVGYERGNAKMVNGHKCTTFKRKTGGFTPDNNIPF